MDEKDIKKLIRKNKMKKIIIIILSLLLLINLTFTYFIKTWWDNSENRIKDLEQELYAFQNKFTSVENIEEHFITTAEVEEKYIEKETVQKILKDEYEELYNDSPEENPEEDPEETIPLIITEENIEEIDREVESITVKLDGEIYTFNKVNQLPDENNVALYNIFKTDGAVLEEYPFDMAYFFIDNAFEANKKGNIIKDEENFKDELTRTFVSYYARLKYYEKHGEAIDTSKTPMNFNFKSRNDRYFVEVEVNNLDFKLKYNIIYEDKQIIFSTII